MRRFNLLLFVTCLLWPSGKSIAQDTLGSELKHGKYSAGFMTAYLTDKSRVFYPLQPERGRPLRVMIWYPGLSKKTPITYSDFNFYFQQAPHDTLYNRYFQQLHGRDINTLNRQYFSRDSLQLINNLKKMKTFSQPNGSVARGKFPIILYALGRNDYQQENTILCEYLASFGFIVVTVPQVGLSVESPRINFTADHLRLQKDDFEFVLKNLSWIMPNADSKKIIAMGHSFGGLVAILLSENNENHVKAIVCLDGSNTVKDGVNLLKETDVSPAAIKAPLLNFFKTVPPNLDLSFTEASVNCDRINVAIAKATHFDFQNWPVFLQVADLEDSRAGRLRSTKEASMLYYSACRVTKDFILTALKTKKVKKVLDLDWISTWQGIEIKYLERP